MSQPGWMAYQGAHAACSTALIPTLSWTVPPKESQGGREGCHSLKGFLEVTTLGKERWISSLPPSDFTHVKTEAWLIVPKGLNGDLNPNLTESKALLSPLRNAAKGHQHALPEKRCSVFRCLSPPTAAWAGAGSTTAMPTETGQMTGAQFKKALT